MTSILDTPLGADALRVALAEVAAQDTDPAVTRILSGRFDPAEDVATLAKEAYLRYLDLNALYFNLFPSISQMEKDIVGAVKELLRGSGSCCGNFTSGGTESIMLAMKAARDFCRATKPHITQPNIVLPITAHPAFHKAADYLGLTVIMTTVDTTGFRADLTAFADAINDQTIICVGSAPNFSHGTVDPIEEMSEIARERGILFHVDACVGGLYLSHLRMAGRFHKAIDFSLPGVTSISTDLHKYGYAPKNASIVLFRTPQLRQHAWFVNSRTTEYTVFNTTVQSTRTAGPVAAAWVTMRYLGHEGYIHMVKRSQDKAAELLARFKDNPHFYVMADPEMCMFTIASDTLNVFELSDAMLVKGWTTVPQFACGGGVENIHVNVYEGVVDRMDQFAVDLITSAETLVTQGSKIDTAAIQQAVDSVAGKSVPEMLPVLLPLAGLKGADLPSEVAPLNTVMNLLPADKRDELLLMFMSMSF
ncbi:MAG: pyridoxal phosphate-dependent decarboxylase family protein [Oceanococcus sp.]